MDGTIYIVAPWMDELDNLVNTSIAGIEMEMK